VGHQAPRLALLTLNAAGTAASCSLARFANLGANKELFSAMCFISPASCPQGVVTRSLRNYVECGGLTPLSAAQLDATQVANPSWASVARPNAARQAAPEKSGVKPPHSI